MTNVHRIEGTDQLLMQTIQDQASSLEQGWREAIQNGIDSSGSTLVELEYDTDKTVVRDDGSGVDLESEEGLDLLKNLGETSKSRGDDSTIGQFGIGKGQAIAMGHTTMMSGDRALHFDIQEWGLQVKEVPLEQEVDGFAMVVAHYGDQVPDEGDSKWDTYDSRVRRRFRHVEYTLGVEVRVNGERASDGDLTENVDGAPTHVETLLTDEGAIDIAVGVQSYGKVEIFSNGVYVTKDYDMGVCGTVVSHANMDVDFGRGGIKDGCPVWAAARDRLEELRDDMFADADPRNLGNDARKYIARRVTEDPAAASRFENKPVFETADERMISAGAIMSQEQIGFAESGSVAADRLSEGYGMTILNEEDDAVQQIQEAASEAAEVFDPQEKAEDLNLMVTGETVPDADLNTVQEKKLLAAREMANRLGIRRDVRWGESDVMAAWTDGHDYIILTDSAAESRNRAAWVWELAETLVHEWCHNDETMEGCSHGRSFDREYRRQMSRAMGTVSEFVTEIEREGLADTVDGVQVVRPDMQDHIEWKKEQ